MSAPYTAEDFVSLLRRLRGVGGFSEDETSVADRELQAWAEVFAAVAAEIADAGLASIPGGSPTFHDEWERIFRLPNDAPRTEEQRAERLAATEQAKAGATESDITSIVARVAPGPSALMKVSRANVESEGTCAEVTYDASEARAIFRAGAAITGWDDPLIRTTMTRLLYRALPARSIGDIDDPDPRKNVSGFEAVTLASSDVRFDAAAFTAPSSDLLVGRRPSRIRSYGPFSVLTSADFNQLQEHTLYSLAGYSDAYANAEVGQESVILRYVNAAPPGTGITADTSIDWRNRVIAVDVTTVSTGGGTTVLASLMWSGGGNLALNGNINLRVNAGTGALEIAWPALATNVAILGIVTAMGSTTAGRVHDRRLVSADYAGPMTSFTYAKLAEWFRKATIREMSAATGAEFGGIRRFAYVCNIPRPSSGVAIHVVDNENDWRDRYLTCRAHGHVGTTTQAAIYPGGPGDGVSAAAVFGSWNTGTGIARGSIANVSATTGTILRSDGSTGSTGLFVDDDTGALCIMRRSDETNAGIASFAVLVEGTCQTGFASSGEASPALDAAADGDLVRAHDLNILQDRCVLTQAQRGYEEPDGSPITESIGSLPLGPICKGSPRLPVLFEVRGREARQNAAGSLRRWGTFTLANGTWTDIDDVEDWRDRVLTVRYRRHTADIRPGGGSVASANSLGTAGGSSCYTKTGKALVDGLGSAYSCNIAGSGASSLSVFADADTGNLVVANNTGSTQYFYLVIEATFPLGPSSELTR